MSTNQSYHLGEILSLAIVSFFFLVDISSLSPLAFSIILILIAFARQ